MAAAQTIAQNIKSKVNGTTAKARAAVEGINLAPQRTAASAAVHDSLEAMGFELPSWQRMAFGFVTVIAAAVAAYVAAPVLAGILTAGTLTVTANGFALWLASALGYLITVWAAFKTAKIVSYLGSVVAQFGGAVRAAAPVAA